MSYTSVYALFKTKTTCITELRNGHGSAPSVWEYISQKLYGKEFNMYDATGFWSGYKDSRLDDDEKAVLLCTYDDSFVEIDSLIEFAAACKKVHKLIISTTHWDWSHFEAIGVAAEELYKNHDYRCKGLAVGCTSVNDRWEQGDIEQVEAWGIYEQLQSMRSEQANTAIEGICND